MLRHVDASKKTRHGRVAFALIEPPAARRAKRTGFTLVELLVVIGIIAVLISMLLPALNKVREQARSIVCQSNMKQLVLAFVAYASEQRGATPIFPPIPGTYPGTTGPERSLAYYTDGAGLLRYDVGAFWPYVSTGPRPAGTPGAQPTAPPAPALYGVMNCPSDSTPRGGFSQFRNFSYSWNAQLWNITGYGFQPNLAIGDIHAVSRITHIIESSHKIVCEEEVAPNDGWSVIGLGPGESGNTADTPAFRHIGRGNWGFADGHVESMLPGDMGYSTTRNLATSAVPINPPLIGYYFHLQGNRW